MSALNVVAVATAQKLPVLYMGIASFGALALMTGIAFWVMRARAQRVRLN